jgi:hypothetical protein
MSGLTPPSSVASYSGPFQAGLIFSVDETTWFEGYYWYCPPGGDTSAQTFCLYPVTITPSLGSIITDATVTSGTLTENAWNYIPLATAVEIDDSTSYVATTAWEAQNGFPDTNDQFGTGDPLASGLTNGPLSTFGQSNAPEGLNAGSTFGVSTDDPTTGAPLFSDSSFDNFWLDVQVSDTAPGGDNASIAGVGAAVSVAAGIGETITTANASISGVAALVTVTGGVGTPSTSASIAGAGAAVTLTAGTGDVHGSASIVGVAATVSVSAGTGEPHSDAVITGVGSQVSVDTGVGAVNTGSSGVVTGVGATITVDAGTGILEADAVITGVAAQITITAGTGFVDLGIALLPAEIDLTQSDATIITVQVAATVTTAQNPVGTPIPPPPSSGLLGWYRTDTLGLNDGDSVTTWPDSSGNGYDMTWTQDPFASGAESAIYTASAINGLPAIYFSSAENHYFYTGDVLSSVTQPVSCYIVVDSPGGDRWASFGANVRFGQGGAANIYAGSGLGDYTITDLAYVGFIVDGVSSVVRVNGVIESTGDAGSQEPEQAMYIGGDGDTQEYEGYIAEVLFYSGALTDDDLAQIDAYIENRYVSTSAIPATISLLQGDATVTATDNAATVSVTDAISGTVTLTNGI